MASIKTSVVDLTVCELRMHVNRGISELKCRESRLPRSAWQNGAPKYLFKDEQCTLNEFILFKIYWKAPEMRRWLLDVFPEDYQIGIQGKGSCYGKKENRGVYGY
jgi:hypothetical protein